MGSECRYNQNISIGIKILCGRIRGTSLGEITSRPETEYGTSACKAVTWCLKPTNEEDLHLLAGIASPNIRRDVCARMEKTQQKTNKVHSLFGQHSAERRLKSRNCILCSVKPAELSPKIIRCNEWLRRLQTTPHKVIINLSESLARGYDSPCTTWRCLTRLRTWFTCSKEQRQKWGYFEWDATCECGLTT